jgi:hypothetical protein
MIGDWVKSYSKGYWKIYRMEKYLGFDATTNSEKEYVSIFSKRLISEKLRKSFSFEVCSPKFVVCLSSEELKIINEYLAENREIEKEFNLLCPKKIDAIFNAKIVIPENDNIEYIGSRIIHNKYLTGIEILEMIENVDLKPKGRFGWTAQFVSKNFKIENGKLVYCFHKILKS